MTDITEFQLPAGKVHLSPVIDCFDGQVVSWSIGTRPDATLVNTMLDDALDTLNENEEIIRQYVSHQEKTTQTHEQQMKLQG